MFRHILPWNVVQLFLSGTVVQSLLLPRPRSVCSSRTTSLPQYLSTTTRRWMDPTESSLVNAQEAIIADGPLLTLLDNDVSSPIVTTTLLQTLMNDTTTIGFVSEYFPTAIGEQGTTVEPLETETSTAVEPVETEVDVSVSVTEMDASGLVPPETIKAPSVAKIFQFAIPAVGVWLCNPLLSLIDTSMVGLLSGTTEQAALNPAVAVTDYGALLIAFMYTATTNLVAASHESDQSEPGKPRSTKTLIGALQLSSYVGAGLGLVLLVLSKVLLRGIIGNDNINPLVFASAVKYVRIRALGMPAAAVIGSAQAGCLGMQDIKSPLYVLAAAAVINLFGDLFFVGRSHPWIGGAAGAAWATVFSQYAAVFFFMRWLCKKPNVSTSSTSSPNLSGWQKNVRNIPLYWRAKVLQGKPSPTPFRRLRHTVLSSSKKIFGNKNDSDAAKGEAKIKPTSRGCLEGRFRLSDLLQFPQRSTTSEFAPYVFPVTTTQVGRVSSYVAMSHVVSSTLGTTSMAAQQVILSLFYCLCPIADSLNLTAQSFVPGIFGKKPSKQRAEALRQITLNFVKAGALFGAIMAGAVSCVPWFSRMFTADPAVVSLVNMVAPYLVGVFSVHGVVCATEGLLLGQKDLGFLGKMYASYFFAVPFLMLRVKKAALLGAQLDLTSVWKVFLGYQWFRFGAWLLRVAFLQRQAVLKAKEE